MKRVMNKEADLISEMISGIVAIYNGSVRKIEGVNGIVKVEIPENKVALVVGSGSGHEPVYHGLIGQNMADAAAIGNIFASPNPEIIMKCAESAERGKGILFLYGNYSGDVMNFDMASELLAEGGISTKTVLVQDDVAVKEPMKRRGIAGLVLIAKVAGAVCAKVQELEEARRIVQKASAQTFSMGVAIEAGTMLNTGEKTFELAEDEIEIGLGLHGEPGVRKGAMRSANALVDEMLAEILCEAKLLAGDEVALLVNDLGAMASMELFIINQRVTDVLAQAGIKIVKILLGKYSTSMDMKGFSLSILKLDPELKPYFLEPASSLALTMHTGE